MKKLIFSQESQKNLIEIYDHVLKNFSKEKAEEVVNQIIGHIQNLRKFPHMGKTSEVSDLVRELIVDGNSIYYHATDDHIEIIFMKPRRKAKGK